MDFVLSSSCLSCVPICSWELWIKLKSTCAIPSIPCPSIFADYVLREPGKISEVCRELWKGATELSLLLGTLVSAHPIPGLNPIPSSSPFREVRGSLSWAEKYLEDSGILSSASVSKCCSNLDLWLMTEKTIQFSENKAPLADVRNHQQCLSPGL